MEPDAQLVQRCLQGDGSAWEELVRRHSRRIFNVCYRFVGNRTEAEDISQEVFLRVYRTLGSYRSAHGGFATWMTSVTRNLLIDHYRRTKRDRQTDSLDDAMPVVENKESAGAAAGSAGADERIERPSAIGADHGFHRSCARRSSCATCNNWNMRKFSRSWLCPKER